MCEKCEAKAELTFPCDFPVKAMGEARDGFAEAVVDVVKRHVPDYDDAATEMRVSSAGKYLSVTCPFVATSRDQLHAIYAELAAHPWVKVTL